MRRTISAAGFDWSEVFFSSAGRLSRAPFLAAAATLAVVTASFDVLVPQPWRLAGLVVWPLLWFSAACILAKRLHDCGRAGWWAAPALLALALARPWRESPLDLFCLAVLVWTLFDLGIAAGEPEGNRFGPNPVTGRPLRAIQA